MATPLDARQVFGQGASVLLQAATRKAKHSHVWRRGSLGELRQHVPGKFSLVPFQHGDKVNCLYQTVVSDQGLPLAIVTGSYALLNHCDLVDSLAHALEELGLDATEYPAELYIGDDGAKFGFRLALADFSYDPGDGYPVSGLVEIVNSADRSLPFGLSMGHLRLVCSNGLKILESTFTLAELHLKGRLNQAMVDEAIAHGLELLPRKATAFRTLHRTGIPEGFTARLLSSIGGAWGVAAAKELERAFEGGTYRKVKIPGISTPVETLWQSYNVLVWVAARSRDLARQVATVEAAHGVFAETMKSYGISFN